MILQWLLFAVHHLKVRLADVFLFVRGQPVSALLEFDRKVVKGLAHITGGGLTDNLPRVLPPGTTARIVRQSWIAPPVFQFLQRQGEVPEDDMYRTFNMGIGLVFAVAPDQVDAAMADLRATGEDPVIIGDIIPA